MSNASKSAFASGRVYTHEEQHQQKKDWKHAENTSPEKFDGTFESGYYTTIELEKKINKAFHLLFSDYYGCAITPDPANQVNPVKVSLYFQPKIRESYTKDEQDIRAFVQNQEKIADPNMSALQNLVRVTSMSDQQRNKEFALTSYAAEILYDFIQYGVKKNSHPTISPFSPESYNSYISETVNMINYQNVKVCAIECLDINAIIGLIYGSKKDNSKYFYTTSLQRPLSGNAVPGIPANWLINITRMTFDQFKTTMAKTGTPSVFGSIRINNEI